MLATCCPANLLTCCPAQARGTYFPLTAFPTSMPQGSVMRRDSSPPPADKSVYGEWHYLNRHNPTAMLTSFNVMLPEETSPPVSMKSKTTGLNFMVSVGRAIESGDNALAKLLQPSQDLVSSVSHHILC